VTSNGTKWTVIGLYILLGFMAAVLAASGCYLFAIGQTETAATVFGVGLIPVFLIIAHRLDSVKAAIVVAVLGGSLAATGCNKNTHTTVDPACLTTCAVECAGCVVGCVEIETEDSDGTD